MTTQPDLFSPAATTDIPESDLCAFRARLMSVGTWQTRAELAAFLGWDVRHVREVAEALGADGKMRTEDAEAETEEGTRLSFVRPLLGVESIRALTGLSEDEILAEIDAGKILWAWNLAGKSSDRVYLRVWNRSVICWINPQLFQAGSIEGVLNQVLPHHRLSLRCTEVKNAFNVSSQHVLNMLDAKLLARVPGDIGPKESPFVTRASVIQLLTDRRIK